MHICLLGVSCMQAQRKEVQVFRVDNLKLSDLVTVKNKEINELKQHMRGQFDFTCMLAIHSVVWVFIHRGVPLLQISDSVCLPKILKISA